MLSIAVPQLCFYPTAINLSSGPNDSPVLEREHCITLFMKSSVLFIVYIQCASAIVPFIITYTTGISTGTEIFFKQTNDNAANEAFCGCVSV